MCAQICCWAQFLKMSKFHLLALLMGVLLVSVPFTRNSAIASDDDDDDDDAASDDDVVVLTEKNFDSIVKKSKFALVSFARSYPCRRVPMRLNLHACLG